MPTQPTAQSETEPDAQPEVTEYDAWVARNPLRAWRAREKLSILRVGARIGASLSSVRHWETGAHAPSGAHLESVAALLGTTPEELTERWETWRAQNPDAAQ